MERAQIGTNGAGIDSLDLVTRKMRISDLEAQGEKYIKGELKRLKQDATGNLRQVAERLLDLQIKSETVKVDEPEEVEEILADTGRAEPPVTQDFENIQMGDHVEGRLEIIHPARSAESDLVAEPNSKEKVDAKWQEISDRLTARENTNKEIADLIDQGKFSEVTSNPEKLQHFAQFEGDIDQLVQRKKDRTGNAPEAKSRRRADGKPFPAPKSGGVYPIEIKKPEPVKESRTVKTIETKPANPGIISVPRKAEPLPRTVEDLLRKGVAQSKEHKDQEIVDAMVEGRDYDRDYYLQNKAEIDREFLRKIGAPRQPGAPEVAEAPQQEIKEATKIAPEKVLAGAEKESSEKKQKSEINGLTTFNFDRLGIKAEDVEREIPNFLKLSPDQQNYILDRLGRKVSKDLNLESADELKKKDASVRAKNTGILGKIKNFGLGIGQGLTKNTRQRLIRNSIEEKLKAGGLNSYKDSLRTLTDFVETRGIDIETNEKGQKVLQFLKRESADDGHKKLIARFNEIASARAEMPMLWSAPEAKKSLREKAKEIEAEYKKAQQRLFQYEMRNGSGESNNGKVIDFLGIDRAVEMNRLLTHNPEVTSFAGSVIRDYKLNSKVSHIALGASVRGIFQYGVALGGGTTALAAMGGGILGSSLTGGLTGALMKKKELRMAIEQKRSGIGDKTKMQGVAGVIDAGDYVRRIDDLIQKINSIPAGKKREQLAQSLRNRVKVAEERMSQQAVNWGKGEKEYLNKFELLQKIGKAGDFLVEESGVSKEVAQKVYAKFDKIHFRDSEKKSERKKEMYKAFVNGATWGGVGAVVGLEANDWLANNGQLTKAGINELVQVDNEMREVVGIPPNELPFTGPETTRINPTPVMNEAPSVNVLENGTETVAEAPAPIAEVSFGSRGAIGTIKDLQRTLIEQYGDNVPDNLKNFVESDPEKLTIDWGMYKPGQAAESISLPKGTSFVAMSDGNMIVKLPDGRMITDDFERQFFDSGARVQNLAPAPAVAAEQIPRFDPSAPGALPAIEGQPVVGAEPGASVYQGHTFEEYRDARLAQGWEHTPVAGGDVFSAAVDPEIARQHAPDFYPEDSAPVEPEAVEGYTNIDGLKVDTKELKGTIDFLYDSKGVIKGLDLPALQVEDVSKFRAHPENFIGGEHDVVERAELGKKLLTMRSEVETFLKYRRIMEIKSLNPDSDEYRFLSSESNKLWSAIQKKVDYQFNPEYQGFSNSPVENTGGTVFPEQPPTTTSNQIEPSISESQTPSIPETKPVEIESTSEFIKTGRDSIRLESQVYLDAVGKYGEATVIDGNVVEFKDGYVGFYDESFDQEQAKRVCQLAANRNASRLGAPVETISYQVDNGKYRILYVYKKR